LEVHISETPGAILKFGMWGIGVGGHLHSKSCLVLYKQHEVMYTWKSHYCFSCQYTHWCGAPASWAARHTTMCLDLGNAWCDLFEIWNLGYWHWRASPQQKSSDFVPAAQSYVYTKIELLFFLLIYSQVLRAGFLGRTTTVCLENSNLIAVVLNR